MTKCPKPAVDFFDPSKSNLTTAAQELKGIGRSMSMYAKLFHQVLYSSLTEKEPIEVRGVFFMLMAAADKSGNVLGSDSTIARVINVPLEQFRRCLEALMAPDPDSKNTEYEGRRVVRLENKQGLFLPSYAKYSGIRTDEERREYFRIKKAESRDRQRMKNPDDDLAPKPETEAKKKTERYVPTFPELPLTLNTAQFRMAWETWRQHRKEIRKPMTPTSERLALAECEAWGVEKAIVAINKAVAKGWQGLFDPDKDRNGVEIKKVRTAADVPVGGPYLPGDKELIMAEVRKGL